MISPPKSGLFSLKGGEVMKQAWDDLKSFVTILFAISLVALLFISIFKSDAIFEMVFLLFTNMCTAVFTFFFSRRKEEKPVEQKEATENEQR